LAHIARRAAPSPERSRSIVDGLSVFDLIRYRRKDHLVSLCAFDLLELNGQDFRDQPLEERKAALKMLLRRPHPGIAYNRNYDVEGSIVFHHACKFGCEGIVSKRLGSPYSSGRSRDWVKVKNPAAQARPLTPRIKAVGTKCGQYRCFSIH
jgi:bifunctional non-homologous end joining protein LigD